MKKVFFSIVITAYNCEKYIKKCILSVLHQDFYDFEIIVIDDCSSDKTLEILKEFKDDRVKIIGMEKNFGVSHSRNIGLKEARGKYVYFADSDDWLNEGALSDIYSTLAQNPCDMLFFPYLYYMADKKRYGRKKLFNGFSSFYRFKTPFSLKNAPKELLTLNYEVWNKVFDREFLIKNSIFFREDLGVSEDLVFYTRVLAHIKSCFYTKKHCYTYFMAHKNYAQEQIEQFIRALEYAKEEMQKCADGEIIKHFEKRCAMILNWWILKLNRDKKLYDFACKFCPKDLIVNVFSPMEVVLYKLWLKVLFRLQ